ncbi:CoA-dependent acyltransferase [Tilletiaria anomala UBC 951]|uniref:Dihydrolipoamide acetyltransferase component of pyruvate dehydrogenase complex n=1 Tax=Tilletiaria anomala (strain ATCC 24038 / CBS 436.72 / UBC 951) TaxID=1037660 RepID=A0A066VRV9_TILAU|nr:CoA-dependent acyltransferase [Tilletiaria anomala UBC 951]KDN43003.1 CoA-dependent acyltransferase [Tilletiaria anomala UBC 951]
MSSGRQTRTLLASLQHGAHGAPARAPPVTASLRVTCASARRHSSCSPNYLSSQRFVSRQASIFGRPRTTAASFHFSSLQAQSKVVPFLLADVGEGITECEIIKWMVQPGAMVEEFDPICEVQSDKASVEITSRYAGKIKSLLYKEGEVARVGSPLCEIEQEAQGGADSGYLAPSPAAEPVQTESSPASDGNVTVESTDTSKVDQQGFRSNPHPLSAGGHTPEAGPVLATPAVRRIARDNQLNLKNVKGTGRDGRVTKEDVLNYIQSSAARSDVAGEPSAAAAVAAIQPGASSSHSSQAPPEAAETVSLDPTRRAMFRAMTATLQVPHFAFSEEIDVTALEQVRLALSQHVPAQYRKTLRRGETEGAITSRADADAQLDKITMLPLLVKALSMALDEHPLFRSQLAIPADVLGKDAQSISSAAKLQRRATHDISIALSTPQGLLTPALQDVKAQSVYSLASRIAQLQTRGHGPKGLPASDLRATGTVTLSNIGAVGGGTYTHPLLPPTGQLAIGALGRTKALPRFASETPLWNTDSLRAEGLDPDTVVRRLIMPVSFTSDHRVVEGAELAKFVLRWKELLENPQSWLGLLK